ncbi:prepilin-type N-terminal cleavage/methylation domain-containing protein [Hydrogenophaga sp.]|uniref:PulJ/GspJ family protein n=1 Tax=Hydrogenophaga sp. TaxID=1904254 RepID=UPI0025BB281F|nr:prepilin-type N-terminal cleavage/methylation domain-containing protein [Hydrogenophaga sp.]
MVPPRFPVARVSHSRATGFTLIELLVAITIMSMLALLSWRSLDGMTRTQAQTQQRADDLLRFQAALGQWTADLDAIVDTREVTPLVFDGRLLRLTRRDPAEAGLESAGVRVVAWTRRAGALPPSGDATPPPSALDGSGQWVRWQSPPLLRRDELARAWQRAADWSREALPIGGESPGSDSAIALIGLENWQLFYHRGDTWGNPLSSVGTSAEGGTGSVVGGDEGAVPNGVRVVLSMPGGPTLGGDVVRDWVRPTLQAGRP